MFLVMEKGQEGPSLDRDFPVKRGENLRSFLAAAARTPQIQLKKARTSAVKNWCRKNGYSRQENH